MAEQEYTPEMVKLYTVQVGRINKLRTPPTRDRKIGWGGLQNKMARFPFPQCRLWGLIISVSPMGVYVSGPSRKFQIHGQALNFHLRFSELQQLPLLGPLIQMDLSSSALRLAVGTEGPT